MDFGEQPIQQQVYNDSMLEDLISRNRSVSNISVLHESDHEDYRNFPMAEKTFGWELLN